MLRSASPFGHVETFVAVRMMAQGDWLHCRVTTLTEDRSINGRVIIATLMMYGLVLGSVLLFTRRLLMPVSRLSSAVRRVGLGQVVLALPKRGPSKIGAVTEAFNGMNARILQMLLDKDAILGALGHDLRPHLFLRLIRNLVENAVKYSGKAQIQRTKTDTALCIHIDDQGPGIPPVIVERLLKPFGRLDDLRNRATGGQVWG